jgi:hypothetical protein
MLILNDVPKIEFKIMNVLTKNSYLSFRKSGQKLASTYTYTVKFIKCNRIMLSRFYYILFLHLYFYFIITTLNIVIINFSLKILSYTRGLSLKYY